MLTAFFCFLAVSSAVFAVTSDDYLSDYTLVVSLGRSDYKILEYLKSGKPDLRSGDKISIYWIYDSKVDKEISIEFDPTLVDLTKYTLQNVFINDKMVEAFPGIIKIPSRGQTCIMGNFTVK